MYNLVFFQILVINLLYIFISQKYIEKESDHELNRQVSWRNPEFLKPGQFSRQNQTDFIEILLIFHVRIFSGFSELTLIDENWCFYLKLNSCSSSNPSFSSKIPRMFEITSSNLLPREVFFLLNLSISGKNIFLFRHAIVIFQLLI